MQQMTTADVILDVFTWPSLAIDIDSVLMSLYTAHIVDPIQSSLTLVKTVFMYSKCHFCFGHISCK